MLKRVDLSSKWSFVAAAQTVGSCRVRSPPGSDFYSWCSYVGYDQVSSGVAVTQSSIPFLEVKSTRVLPTRTTSILAVLKYTVFAGSHCKK